jgi:glyoxalase family protein
MRTAIRGIHHVTAIAGDPQANVDFYTGPLGLRLVKQTVNFDDPTTWHLYYGDAHGTPGSVLTFFPFVGARRGQPGAGQVTETAFAVPEAALGFWVDRLQAARLDPVVTDTEPDRPTTVRFRDPDGLPLSLVATPAGAAERMTPWPTADVAEHQAIRGFHGVRMAVLDVAASRAMLVDQLGFADRTAPGGPTRVEGADGGPGTFVELEGGPGMARGLPGAGTVHHVAFRVADDADQLAWREHVAATTPHVTPVADRQYFRSIYFREPGGVLYELATDGPGFTVDEAPEVLGSALRLPPWFEPRRTAIEAGLPPIR